MPWNKSYWEAGPLLGGGFGTHSFQCPKRWQADWVWSTMKVLTGAKNCKEATHFWSGHVFSVLFSFKAPKEWKMHHATVIYPSGVSVICDSVLI